MNHVARLTHQYSPDNYWGLDLDEILEGPCVVPIVDPSDRCAQVVVLPPLTAQEREQVVGDWHIDALEIERNANDIRARLERFERAAEYEAARMIAYRVEQRVREQRVREQRVRETQARPVARPHDVRFTDGIVWHADGCWCHHAERATGEKL